MGEKQEGVTGAAGPKCRAYLRKIWDSTAGQVYTRSCPLHAQLVDTFGFSLLDCEPLFVRMVLEENISKEVLGKKVIINKIYLKKHGVSDLYLCTQVS